MLLGYNCSVREGYTIGEYCIISRNVTINYDTRISSHTTMMDNSHITGCMEIGNYVFISVLVSSTNDTTMGRDKNAVECLAGPAVENYATIGAGACLLPSIRVGQNAIIGTGYEGCPSGQGGYGSSSQSGSGCYLDRDALGLRPERDKYLAEENDLDTGQEPNHHFSRVIVQEGQIRSLI